jgi:hypothetical protein
MLTTQSDYIDFEVSDSTVRIFPGAVKLGSLVTIYRGDQTSVAGLARLSTAGDYQYAVLAIAPFGQGADMTAIRSASASSIRGLSYPVMPDSTSTKALGLFTLHTTDGTSVDLVSWMKVS